MKRILLSGVFAVALISLFDSCKKGDIGPAGAIGPSGATGATGAAGAVGDTGVANVIYSPWTNLTFTGSSTTWSAKMTAPEITQEILDKGLVKTYFKFATNVYEGTYVNVTGGGSIGIYQYLALGVINLRSTFAANFPWRYMIIPGGIPNGKINTQYGSNTFFLQDGTAIDRTILEKMSYEETCKRFNIPFE